VVLFIALIVLVAMTLAGIAVMRSVGTNVLISGNMAFKQAATSVADYGVETAGAWISGATATTLQNDGAPGSPTAGYYSSWKYDPTAPTDLTKNFDPFQFNWNNAKVVAPAPDPSTQVQYVIHRMCTLPNTSIDDINQQCVFATTTSSGSTGSTQNVLSGGQAPLTPTSQVYYRVTVKVTGPKNSISFIQTTLY
jgi:Tfp pilus assembly protein PilX